jgi:hypothetical protein
MVVIPIYDIRFQVSGFRSQEKKNLGIEGLKDWRYPVYLISEYLNSSIP